MQLSKGAQFLNLCTAEDNRGDTKARHNHEYYRFSRSSKNTSDYAFIAMEVS